LKNMVEFMGSNWIFPSDMLENTPSRVDGYSKEVERIYRNKTTFFIETLGSELKWYVSIKC
jgi:hypothetical protein